VLERLAVPVEHDSNGRPIWRIDDHGNTAWSIAWDDDRLEVARLRLPDGRTVEMHGNGGEHPLFGRCDTIGLAGESAVARVAATDWAAPAAIPPLDVPGVLPSGTGTAVLNLLATMAARAEVAALRYFGPYPTGALFETLLASFDVGDDVEAFRTLFTADALARSMSGRLVEAPVDFVPAPHTWSWPASRICVQTRNGVERVYLDGRPYRADTMGPRRLHVHGDRIVLAFEVAGQRHCEVAVLELDGKPRGAMLGAIPVPEGFGDVPIPGGIAEVLAVVMIRGAPEPLRPLVAKVFAERSLVWGDAGFELAIASPDQLVVHAALAEPMLSLDAGNILARFVEALEPVVLRVAQAELAQAFAALMIATPEDG
jgi:hypothetical protein